MGIIPPLLCRMNNPTSYMRVLLQKREERMVRCNDREDEGVETIGSLLQRQRNL